LTRLFAGSYLCVGTESSDFTINPFCLAPTKPNLDFLTLFVRVLLGNSAGRLTPRLTRPYEQIENLYSLDPALRTLDVLANTFPAISLMRLQSGLAAGSSAFFSTTRRTLSRFPAFSASTFRK